MCWIYVCVWAMTLMGYFLFGLLGGLGCHGLGLALFFLLAEHGQDQRKHRRVGVIPCTNRKCRRPMPQAQLYCHHCYWVRLEGAECTRLWTLIPRNALLLGGVWLLREGVTEHADPTVKYPLLFLGFVTVGGALIWQFRVTLARERTAVIPDNDASRF